MTDLQTMAETSLYDDHSSGSMSGESSQNSPSESAGGTLKRPTAISLSNSTSSAETTATSKSIKELKKNLTLDFKSPESVKKTLATPDIVRFLQLASPDLEKFITQGVVQVTTPTPTNFLFPKTVTSEQEQYARGFIDALNHIHQLNNFSPGANLLSPAGLAATLAANTAAVAAAVSSKATTSAAEDTVVTSTSTSKNSPGKLVQSPTNPGTSVASVIMNSVGFPVSMGSGGLNLNLNSYNTLLSAGIPGPGGMGSIPAAMALFNLQSSREQKLNASLLSEDRPPSQSAEPGSMEFTNLSQAAAPVAQSVSVPPAAVGVGSFQSPAQAAQYLEVTSTTTASHMPQKASRLIKQEPDQAVPNVSLQLDGSFGLQGTSGTSVLDLKAQEVMKLERKRYRNRIAATKCRKRKMEKISDLEAEVKDQETDKKRLNHEATDLKNEIARLRADLELHRNSGCPVHSVKLMNGMRK